MKLDYSNVTEIMRKLDENIDISKESWNKLIDHYRILYYDNMVYFSQLVQMLTALGGEIQVSKQAILDLQQLHGKQYKVTQIDLGDDSDVITIKLEVMDEDIPDVTN